MEPSDADANKQSSDSGTLQRFVAAAADWLIQDTGEKKRLRDEQQSIEEVSPWRRFLKDLARPEMITAIFAVLAGVAGGAWTVREYFDKERTRIEQEHMRLEQDRRNAEQRTAERKQQEARDRKTAIAQFSRELASPTGRNSAAYAVAILAERDALPLLIPHLKEAALRNEDESFRSALVYAIASLGEAALDAAVRLNREARNWDGGEDTPRRRLALATGDIMLGVLANGEARHRMRDGGLDGVELLRGDFVHSDLAGIRMRDASISALVCGGNLQGSDFSNSYFSGNGPMHADFSAAQLRRTEFTSGYDLGGAKFDLVNADGARFDRARLDGASLRAANLVATSFVETDLAGADLSNADLTRANLSGAVLRNAQLDGAKLSGADLAGADLFRASFKRADLRDTKFNVLSGAPVRYDREAPTSHYALGALVLGADFAGASGVNDETRRYLCAVGALNVPGGCHDVVVKDRPDPPQHGSGASRSCF